MIRRLLLSGMLLLAVPSAAVVAAADVPAPGSTRVADAPECGGAGFDKLVVGRPNLPYVCVHAAVDSYSALRGSRPVPAVGVKPTCYGDGETGARVQLVYGYAEGAPNRAKTAIPQIRDVVAPRMEAIIRAASGGKDLGLRFAFEPGCKRIDVQTVAFPESVQFTENVGAAIEQYVAITAHLDEIGLNRSDRKYLVMWDGWTDDGTCGIATLLSMNGVSDLPQQANLHNGLPTAGGYTDPGTAASSLGPDAGGIVPKHAVVWNHVFGRTGPSCWGIGRTQYPAAAVHELFHTLSAVQKSAPNSDGAGHCLDAPSIMCYGKHVVHHPQCDRKGVPVLDCGQNDYWSPDPVLGSYLDTHANVARSQFFGPQLQDVFAQLPERSPI